MEKVNDRELKKLIKLLGCYKVKELFCEGKLKLTSSQLDYVIEEGKSE